MGKKIKNIVLLIVAISVLLSGQIPISAKEVNSKRYTKDVSGTLYYVTDEYDCNGVRHITYTNNEKTICASYDGKIIQIVSDVEQHTLILEKTKTNEGNFVQTSYELQPQRANYCGSKIVSAFGYSGKVYSYATNTFGTITLQSGALSKTGTSNAYSGNFYIEILNMSSIYASLSDVQLQAWVILRVYGLLTSYSIDAIDLILTFADVDLEDELYSTVLFMNDWYQAEQRASSCYDLF